MTIEELTVQEIDILLDAVDAWRKRDASAEIMHEIMTSAFGRNDPRVQYELQKRHDDDKRKKQLQNADEADTAIMLKAKLVLIKRNLLANREKSPNNANTR